MLQQLTFFLLFLAYFHFNGNAQEKKDPAWEIFLDDSLIISGSFDTNNASRPIALIDIDKGNELKQFTFIYKTPKAYNKQLEFKENDSTIYSMDFFADYSRILDTLVIVPDFHRSLPILKGKIVKVYYSDDMLQKTPILLGTLIIKKD